MPRQPTPIPVMQSNRSRGGGGGGASAASIAIGNFITDQNQAQKKMMDNFTKLSEAQAQESSMNAAQMTQSMNQVVAREDEKQVREENMQEKMKDREYGERHQKWTANLQKDMAKDFTATQTRVAEQTNATRDFLKRMDTNRVEFGDRIRGMRQMLHDPRLVDYWTNTPGGMDRLEEMTSQLRVAELFHEQDYRATISGEVTEKLSRVLEQIERGEPHADLRELAGLSPAKAMAGMSWTKEEVEELYHTGGYPPGGLYGRDPDDPALQKYRGFNPIDLMSTMAFLEDEQFLAVVKHKKFRDDYQYARLENFKDMKEEHDKMVEFSTKAYDNMAPSATEGAYYGLTGFINDLGTGKLSPDTLAESTILKYGVKSGDMMDVMATKIFESMWLSMVGPGSEDSLKVLNELLGGDGPDSKLDVPVEAYRGLHMRAALRHIEDQALGMTLAATKGGVPMSMSLAKTIYDMPESPGKTNLLRALAMVPGDVQRGELLQPITTRGGRLDVKSQAEMHDGVNRLLKLVKQKAMKYLDVVESQPIMETHTMTGGYTNRYVDGSVAALMSDELEKEEGRSFDARAKGISATDAKGYGDYLDKEDALPDEDEFSMPRESMKMARRLTPYQAIGELGAGVSTNPEFIAAIYSADLALRERTLPPVSGSNFGGYQPILDGYIGDSRSNREKLAAKMKRDREGRANGAVPQQGAPARPAPVGDEGPAGSAAPSLGG
ncbi:hypothetical protein LCGC14_0330340 [marine sediment metagenome]|uniref:Uncharacterized protein n=1 Tax=marine sediment metagenome TaxID=412755 RepID=A0A0F9W460_9ZZZZ